MTNELPKNYYIIQYYGEKNYISADYYRLEEGYLYFFLDGENYSPRQEIAIFKNWDCMTVNRSKNVH
jgi:hypothetical protein